MPLEQFAGAGFDVVPFRIAVPHAAVARLEHRRHYRIGHGFCHLLAGRPNIFQKHIVAVAALAQGFFGQIDIGRAGQCVGDDQWWAGKIIRFHQRIHTAFEVAIAAENRRRNQIAIVHGLRDRFRQRAAVANAGGAAVADGLKTQGVRASRSVQLCRDNRSPRGCLARGSF